jgi:hypothetical protein
LAFYRFYFNSRADAPLVWSYDTGPGSPETIVETIEFVRCSGSFKFDPEKHLPEASAWIEVTGELEDSYGHVIVHGD